MKIFEKFFNYNKNIDKVKPGKGIRKKKITDKEKYSLKSFFVIYKEKFWKLTMVNMMFILLCLPIFAAVFAYFEYFDRQIAHPASNLYPIIYGAVLNTPTPAGASLIGVFGTYVYMNVPTAMTYIFYGISLLTIFTFGPANIGMTYMVRAFARGDFVYIWHDFWYAIKKNFFSGILLGLADLVIIILLAYSILFYNAGSEDFMYSILFFGMIMISFLYFTMRFYLYLLHITCRLRPGKLIKNSLIFVFLGFKRNIMASVGIFVYGGINLLILMYLPNFGVILPLVILFGHCAFMSAFAAYYNIKKYVLDPYYKDHPDEDAANPTGEPIFLDRG